MRCHDEARSSKGAGKIIEEVLAKIDAEITKELGGPVYDYTKHYGPYEVEDFS
jgi:hypothetical protein